MDKYTYRVTWSEEDQAYVATCLEFPSLSWLDASYEQALSGIRRTVADVLSDMEKSGERSPVPFATRKYSGNYRLRMPANLHKQLTIEAAEQEISLNRLINHLLESR
ncbi:type II toxin-antitoxin system HicB family antitoxin [Desulfofustis limnaeus]|jgi:predicted HicB family RNase H-like nuclease|uniref:Antitoxin HicB n=1 Tax=Desulfofustis limnaeus TaxID=2740163 RepID=A0ABM7W7A9_9BACT|nr:toxin-antitoxin system HicB family antitoxin [Desulfofustis limnaeus]BDD86866.1 antitoxin HicB [Desulfofustis limnaeus]